MKKPELQFPLHNSFFYWGSILMMVVILVTCNNFFFYRSKDKTLAAQLEDTVTLIGGQYTTCLQARQAEVCQDELRTSLSKTFDFGELTILDHERKEIVAIDKETYKDSRLPITQTGTFGTGVQEILIVQSKLSSPPIYASVLNSITISAKDIYTTWRDGKDVSKFFVEVALPRSYSVFYALIVIWFIMQFARKTDDARKRHQEVLRKRLLLRTKALQEATEKSSLAELEVEEFKRKAEQEGAMTREFELELDKKLKELENYREQQQTLLLQLEARQEKTQEVETSSDDKAIEEFLLEILEPCLEKEKFTFNEGMHHGKDFVLRVCKSHLKDDIGARLIKRVNSTANGPRKRGKLILEWNDSRKEFTLYAYSPDHNAGYGVEFALSARNITEAILTTRYLTAYSKGKLRGMGLKFEIHSTAKAA